VLILRYIYIPIGGASNLLPATVLVFTFVALWHDLSFRLLAWGWLVSLFILPELLARRLVPVSKVSDQQFATDSGVLGFYILLFRTLSILYVRRFRDMIRVVEEQADPSVRWRMVVQTRSSHRRRGEYPVDDDCQPRRLCHGTGGHPTLDQGTNGHMGR
jgi:hypothetical protein